MNKVRVLFTKENDKTVYGGFIDGYIADGGGVRAVVVCETKICTVPLNNITVMDSNK